MVWPTLGSRTAKEQNRMLASIVTQCSTVAAMRPNNVTDVIISSSSSSSSYSFVKKLSSATHTKHQHNKKKRNRTKVND